MQLHTYIVKTRVFVVNNGTCLLVNNLSVLLLSCLFFSFFSHSLSLQRMEASLASSCHTNSRCGAARTATTTTYIHIYYAFASTLLPCR